MHKFKVVGRKGQGAFSEVVKAQNTRSNQLFALKCLKKEFSSAREVGELREVRALRALSGHPNIVILHEVIFQSESGKGILVLELMDQNFYDVIRVRRYWIPESRVMRWMYQVFLALEFIHSRGYFHRDIKPENLLLSGDSVKIADLGSCKPTNASPPFTEYISTRWYRSPECLLTDGFYNPKMDVWAAGCVLFELVALTPLFPGDDERDQLDKIHRVLGSPDISTLDSIFGERLNRHIRFSHYPGTGIRGLIPHSSSAAVDLVRKSVSYSFHTRISAKDALASSYFSSDVRQEYSSTRYVVDYIDSLNSVAHIILNIRRQQATDIWMSI